MVAAVENKDFLTIQPNRPVIGQGQHTAGDISGPGDGFTGVGCRGGYGNTVEYHEIIDGQLCLSGDLSRCIICILDHHLDGIFTRGSRGIGDAVGERIRRGMNQFIILVNFKRIAQRLLSALCDTADGRSGIDRNRRLCQFNADRSERLLRHADRITGESCSLLCTVPDNDFK